MQEQISMNKRVHDTLFPMLPVDELLNVTTLSGDDVAVAAAAVTRPMPTNCSVKNLTALHDQALQLLDPPAAETLVTDSSTAAPADAYDSYFSVVRTSVDCRRVLAFGTLSAFRDLFNDMQAGTDLDAIDLNNIRTVEYELLRLIAEDKDLYY